MSSWSHHNTFLLFRPPSVRDSRTIPLQPRKNFGDTQSQMSSYFTLMNEGVTDIVSQKHTITYTFTKTLDVLGCTCVVCLVHTPYVVHYTLFPFMTV